MRGYLSIQGRDIYCNLAEVAAAEQPAWCALVLQPFGEEKRCALRTVVRICKKLADAGIPAMTFDFSGTGDSSGDHAQARLSHWQAEAMETSREVKSLTGASKLHLVALRSAALATISIPCEKLTLAEPLFTGRDFLHELERRELIKAIHGGASSDQSQKEYAGFPYSDQMLRELGDAEVDPDFPNVRGPTQIIHVTGGKTCPPSWQPYLKNAASLLLRDRPFWGLTDYFESLLPDFIASQNTEPAREMPSDAEKAAAPSPRK